MNNDLRNFLIGMLFLFTILLNIPPSYAAEKCIPTRPDMEGPFYKPNAPLRNKTGIGLIVKGRVLAYPDCRPIPKAVIEYWHANPDGVYDDAHRAILLSDKDGGYMFVTNFPGIYPGRPPHIHLKIKAAGFRPLTTQLYFKKQVKEEIFDIVLMPDKDMKP